MRDSSKRQSETQTIIGIDISDRRCAVTEMDRETGEVVGRYSVPTNREALAARFSGRERCLVVMEVGKQSPWMSRLFKELGHEVLVANARKVRLIHQSKNKSDRVDSEILTRLGRVDPTLLFPIEHRSEEAQLDLSVLRARDSLVRARTQLINSVRGMVKSVGGAIKKCDARAFASAAAPQIPKELRQAVVPVLESIGQLTEQIKGYDKQVRILTTKKYPECELLQSIPGVGPLTALTYRLVIDSPERFSKSRRVGAYLGLVPGQSQSGDSSAQLRITKAGDKMARKYLVQAAQYILGRYGEDCELRRHGERIASVGGRHAKRRAVIAVARKLAVVMHRLWQRGEIYQPFSCTDDSAAA